MRRSPRALAPPRGLPQPRGPLSESLFAALVTEPSEESFVEDVVSFTDEDLQLSLYCLYELHYGGFGDVDGDWEWAPSLLQLRQLLEERFEGELRGALGSTDASDVVEELWHIATEGGGPSLSGWVAERASLEQFTELAKHRSLYQLKEADPHTWGIPRLRGPAKAAMVEIQADEYGNGTAEEMHSSLFSTTMSALELDTTPNAYLDEAPAVTLATTNLISLFGLHQRLRGALVGHLALFEMTSIGPMGRYAKAATRLGLPPEARQFYEVHVVADEVHQKVATEGMVAGLLADEPELGHDVLFGARALSLVERRFTDHVLGCWTKGESSLRTPALS